jgi:hypothetical protein
MPILDPQQVLAGNDNMGFIDYNTLAEDGKEFMRTDLWQFEFSVAPLAVYYPGKDVINRRLVGVTPSIDTSITDVEHNVRGFDISQAATIKTSGTMDLAFIDREDQSIHVMDEDWKDKSVSKNERYSFRKEDIVATAVYTLFNTSRQPIRRYTFFNVRPTTGGNGNLAGENEASSRSELTMSLKFEHYTVEYLNI